MAPQVRAVLPAMVIRTNLTGAGVSNNLCSYPSIQETEMKLYEITHQIIDAQHQEVDET